MPCLKKQNFNLGQVLHLVIRGLTLELLRTPLGPFADIVDQDQTAQNVQSDLGSRSTLSDKEIVLHPPPKKKKKLKKKTKNKRTMMVLYRSPEHICNLYGLSRAGY